MAVLFVVFYHAGLPIPGGFVGVDMFFVISGFVITLVLQREWARTGGLNLGHFYTRRFKRLTPALALVLAVTVLLSPLLLSPLGPQADTALTALGAIFLAANIVIIRTTGDYFDAPANSNALLHTWSLSVEEQFYLVFPMLMLLIWRVARGKASAPTVAVIAVAVPSLALALAGARGLEGPLPDTLIGFYGPATRVWEFAVGAVISLAGLRASRATGTGTLASIIGVGLLTASALLISESTPFPGAWTLLPVMGSALLIAFTPSNRLISRALSSQPLVWIGDRSYSIYLWHWPLIVFASASFPHSSFALLGAALFAFLPAAASFRWLEEPLRRMPLPPWRGIVKAGLTMTIPVIAFATAVLVANSRSYGSEQLAAINSTTQDIPAGCHEFVPLGSKRAEPCTWNSEAEGSPIVLLGDSHALHLSEGLIAAGVSIERPVIVSTAVSCPMVDVYIDISGPFPNHARDCRTYVEGSLEYLDGAEPRTVILGSSDLYWRDSSIAIGLTQKELSRDPSQKIEITRIAWTRTVERIRDAGHEVVILLDVPRWSDEHEWSPEDCTGLELIRTGVVCRKTMPIDAVIARQGAVRVVLQDVGGRAGAGLLDPWTQLCPEGICTTWANGIMTYRDSNHLSNAQSLALAEWLTADLANSRLDPS